MRLAAPDNELGIRYVDIELIPGLTDDFVTEATLTPEQWAAVYAIVQPLYDPPLGTRG